MQKNQLFIAIVALIIGIGIGYAFVGWYQTPYRGMHMMSDGYMMPNGHMMNMDMDEMMDDMNARLVGKTGDEFDRVFISEMIVHHRGAVEMAQLALAQAKHQEIKDLAGEIIAAQNKEIDAMKKWQAAWYGINATQ